MKTDIEAINALADWWTDRLRAPEHDNGGGDLMSAFAGALASDLASRNTPTDEQMEKFNVNLRVILESDHGELDDGRSVCIGVDYGPGRELAEAADRAGVDSSRFPWKTRTWLYRDRVLVAAGYGAEHEQIYPATEDR